MESKVSTVEDDAVFPILLRYLYSNEKLAKNELSQSNIFSLLSLAHAFGAIKLVDELQVLVSDSFLTTDNAVRFFYESLMVDVL